MTTVILGTFDNQEKADQAISEIQNKFQKNNISVNVKGENSMNPSSSSSSFNVLKQFSFQASKMGETAGGLMGNMAGMAMGAMMSVPMMMVNTMMNSVSGMTSMTGTTGMSTMGSMDIGQSSSSTNSGQRKVTVTIQSHDDISNAQNILKHHGAKETSVYSS